jgi:protein-tyrosine phosphatase
VAVETDPKGDGPFDVVFVCTGNRARSPLAQALFERYAQHPDVVASSVGTVGPEGEPALSDAVEASKRLAVDLSRYRARVLRHGSLADADLVLGFEPSHLFLAVVEGEAAPGRTFLLAELVRLLEGVVAADGSGAEADPLARARTFVYAADLRRVRGRTSPADTIADPLGKSRRTMRRTSGRIDALVQALVASLFGPAHPRGER